MKVDDPTLSNEIHQKFRLILLEQAENSRGIGARWDGTDGVCSLQSGVRVDHDGDSGFRGGEEAPGGPQCFVSRVPFEVYR